jgi:hypothetical protein
MAYPRPTHIDRGLEVIQWDKQTDWIKETCMFDPIVIESGDGFLKKRPDFTNMNSSKPDGFGQQLKCLEKPKMKPMLCIWYPEEKH